MKKGKNKSRKAPAAEGDENLEEKLAKMERILKEHESKLEEEQKIRHEKEAELRKQMEEAKKDEAEQLR